MKKVLALALVLVLAIGMMVPATAATKKIIEGFDTVPADDYFVYDLEPGDEIPLVFSFASFDLSAEALTALASVRSQSAFNSQLLKIAETAEPRFRVRSGGQIFKSIEVDKVTVTALKDVSVAVGADIADAYDTLGGGDYNGGTAWTDVLGAFTGGTMASADVAYLWVAYTAVIVDSATFTVLLETVDPFVSVSDVDYEVEVYFLIDGYRTDDEYICTISGEFANQVTEVDNDDYDVDSYLGQVIKAVEYVSDIAICGNYEYDINANVKMAKDKKIYFYVTTEADMSDESVFDRYPAIEVAFKVHQVGLNAYTGNFISLDGVDSDYYVYGKGADGGLKYLGRGGELLPLSAKYYISTMKLDLSDDEPVDEIPVDVPSIVDDYNPSTGI